MSRRRPSLLRPLNRGDPVGRAKSAHRPPHRRAVFRCRPRIFQLTPSIPTVPHGVETAVEDSDTSLTFWQNPAGRAERKYRFTAPDGVLSEIL